MKTWAFVWALCLFCTVDALYAGSATWNVNARSDDWNTAANWRPRTVPHLPTDTATFGASDTTSVSLSAAVQIAGIHFTAGASAFTIATNPGRLGLGSDGIVNDSGVMQNFSVGQGYIGLAFHNKASAGTQTAFLIENLSDIVFHDQATAGAGTFTTAGTPGFMDGGSAVVFYDTASAGSAVFVNQGGSGSDAQGGATVFVDRSTAASGTFTNMAASYTPSYSSSTGFHDNATAAAAVITNQGGIVVDGDGGETEFVGTATAGNARIICDSGQVAGSYGGFALFLESATAGSATLIANGGVDGVGGGDILFEDVSDGGKSRVQLFGNGTLNLAALDSAGLSIGSLEGDGIVSLDIHNLTVGTNGLSTSFSGMIEDSGSVTKVGVGTLTFSSANTYTGGTTVSEGFLQVANTTGSATGAGAVQINSGTLGGGGIVAGPVTVGSGSGSGAFLAPGSGATTLTVQSSLSFNTDGTYTWRINTRAATSDTVVANGVTIESGAQFNAIGKGNARLPIGAIFTTINNVSANSISGAFSSLPDNSTFTAGGNNFQVSYEGGDGNDLTLTVVP